MSYTPGKPSQSLQFLRLNQLEFELLSLCDILEGFNNACQRPIRAVKRSNVQNTEYFCSVTPIYNDLFLKTFFTFQNSQNGTVRLFSSRTRKHLIALSAHGLFFIYVEHIQKGPV